MFVVGGVAVGGGGGALDLDLEACFDTGGSVSRPLRDKRTKEAYRSNGYTSVLAMTAPAAPATALPHGGSVSTLDCPAMLKKLCDCAFGAPVAQVKSGERMRCGSRVVYCSCYRMVSTTTKTCQSEKSHKHGTS